MYQFYFEKLEVWKLSMRLSKMVYQVTTKFPNNEMFGMVSQLRRSSLSISNNIVEGLSRDSYLDQARFTSISYGSLVETLNGLILARDLDYIEQKSYIELRELINELSNKLNSFRKSQLNRHKSREWQFLVYNFTI